MPIYKKKRLNEKLSCAFIIIINNYNYGPKAIKVKY